MLTNSYPFTSGAGAVPVLWSRSRLRRGRFSTMKMARLISWACGSHLSFFTLGRYYTARSLGLAEPWRRTRLLPYNTRLCFSELSSGRSSRVLRTSLDGVNSAARCPDASKVLQSRGTPQWLYWVSATGVVSILEVKLALVLGLSRHGPWLIGSVVLGRKRGLDCLSPWSELFAIPSWKGRVLAGDADTVSQDSSG